MKPILIFDICETLLDVDTSKWHPLSSIGGFKELLYEYEKGHIQTEEFLEELENRSNFDDILNKFNSIFSGNWKEGMQNLLSNLIKDGYEIHLLSNLCPIHWDIAAPILEGYFNKAYLSFEIGARKPNPNIYNYVNSDLGIDNNVDVLFFDDRPENIKAAREFGWHPHLFKFSGPVERFIKFFD